MDNVQSEDFSRPMSTDSTPVVMTGPAVSDPTPLTTQQILREIAMLRETVYARLEGMAKATDTFREDIIRVPTDTDKQVQQLRSLLEAKMDGNQHVISTRLEAMDKAKGLLYADINDQIGALQKLHAEKFASIQTQFEMSERQRVEQKKDTKDAVDAALTAQKEAVTEQNKSNAEAISKSEASTTKQIDGLNGLIPTIARGADDKIDDLKDRMNRIEGRDLGVKDTHTDNRSLISVIASVAFGLIGIILGILGMTLHLGGH